MLLAIALVQCLVHHTHAANGDDGPHDPEALFEFFKDFYYELVDDDGMNRLKQVVSRSDLLATTRRGMPWSCIQTVCSGFGDPAVLRFLVRCAEERGQLAQLLAMTDTRGQNVFHHACRNIRLMEDDSTKVRNLAALRILLDALDRLGLCRTTGIRNRDCRGCAAARDAVHERLPSHAPVNIGDLITSFLPQPTACQLRYGLLNHQSSYGKTPLMAALRNEFADSMIPLLVKAGANPNRKDKYRQTVLDKVKSLPLWSSDQIQRNVRLALILYLKPLMQEKQPQ